MTVVIMLQKSEGGALGIGGGGGGLMTGRSAAGVLVRVTMFFGGIFFLTSLGLTTLANRTTDDRTTLERAAEERLLEEGEDAPELDIGGPLLETPPVDEDVIAPPIDENQAEPTAPPLDDDAPDLTDNPQ